MIVARVPWFAVQQYATVVLPGIGPRSVLDPRGAPSMVVLRHEPSHRVTVYTVNPDALVDVLVPELTDALAVLSRQFTVEEIPE